MQTSVETKDSLPSRSIVYLVPMRNQAIRGRVYSEYYKKTLQFNNEGEMLKGMDDLFDSLTFPQAAFETRNFSDRKNVQIIKKAEDTMDDSMDELLQNQKTTFIVNVQYRQNATWQGTITWVEQDMTQHFRSSLEMLKLMEQASNQGATEVIKWDED